MKYSYKMNFLKAYVFAAIVALLFVCVSQVSSSFLDNFEIRRRMFLPQSSPSAKTDILNTYYSTSDDPKNIRKGDSEYKYIPSNNTRWYKIKNLRLWKDNEGRVVKEERKGLKWKEAEQISRKSIMHKHPIFEDKQEIQTLELQLLEMGFTVTCTWQIPLPPPLKTDNQCTRKELKEIIQRLQTLIGET